MQDIKLNKNNWGLDTKKPLGSPGGFGEVFLGTGDIGEVAIKRLKVTASEAAHRELQIGQFLSEQSLTNIVPVLDYGQDADSDRYFIVMPVCDHDLQNEITNKGTLSPIEAIEVIIAILSGLSEMQNITHRDLKPSNILMHESIWKIADFGIAKFVEDSTSLETLRSCLTPPYAAPEQWLMQRPTNATDIYAVGCIAHSLVTGQPPFTGDVDTLRDHHLKSTPPSLNDFPPSIRSIVSQMLRKNPDIRPKLERCISVFQREFDTDSIPKRTVDSKIAEAVSEIAIVQAQREAEHQEREERKRNREHLFNECAQDLNRIKERLFGEIQAHAQDVMEAHSSKERFSIGHATLAFDTSLNSNGVRGLRKSDSEEMGGSQGWGVHKKQSEWDIVGFTSISIEQRVAHQTYTRCANIVLGRPSNNSEYRWYEISYWTLSRDKRQDEPFCLEYVWEMDKALSKVMDTVNLAHDPIPIDGENEDSFIEYWMGLIAQAMIGKLSRPSRMPMTR
jgi:serine/threonine-protein kinase